jgi:uracil-DNA glycosylase
MSPPPNAGRLPEDWAAVLSHVVKSPSWERLQQFVAEERRHGRVYPPEDEVFTAFHLTPFADVRVVILGQDPYPNAGQGHGLSFSVKPGVPIPASLRNIFKELHADLGIPPAKTGCLIPWARQGVLLINAVLTVLEKDPKSHTLRGWETLTDAVFAALNSRPGKIVFVLWGALAQAKLSLIDTTRHAVVKSAHPSPLSARKFFGSKPFSKVNAAIEGAPIDWALERAIVPAV